jgi:hypothetical protein
MSEKQEIRPVRRLKSQPIAQGTLVGEPKPIGYPYVTKLADGSYVESKLPLTPAQLEACETRHPCFLMEL